MLYQRKDLDVRVECSIISEEGFACQGGVQHQAPAAYWPTYESYPILPLLLRSWNVSGWHEGGRVCWLDCADRCQSRWMILPWLALVTAE